MRILRVFPRRTKATPTDELVRIGKGPGLERWIGREAFDEVRVSVTFSWDMPKAKRLAEAWSEIAPTTIGGPAFLDRPSGEFVPGLYLKKGCTITSRGCPNRCWFCKVWEREPKLLELPIFPGNNVMDDNLLACSEGHVRAVFGMLKEQKAVGLTGGLEARLLRDWHVNLLAGLSLRVAFFAYDTPDDQEPLEAAGRMLRKAGFDREKLRTFCLVGYPKDTFEKAERRLIECWNFGFMPMAMLYRKDDGIRDRDWIKFQKRWVRPAGIKARMREEKKC